MASLAGSGGGSSYAASVTSSRSSASMRARAERERQEGSGEDLLDRRSPLENGIFGVLFTLSKENSETRIRYRWTLLKILLDAWQLFTTVINPGKQGWRIKEGGTAWVIVSVLNFTWLADLGYGAYLAVLYAMVALLMGNVCLCVWVAWCFKEHKFPVVWPIKVLRVFSSVFFQAFDVASLNLLQLGISCNYTGGGGPRLHMNLFPEYSCTTAPHIFHAIVSALSLVLFVTIALLLNMAEVEVNPLSRRPLALGHSGAEVMAFAIKALMTLVDVFLGWPKVSACVYLALSLALAWQSLRWSPHLVSWVNYLKGGVAATIMWSCVALMLLVFHPGIKGSKLGDWQEIMTLVMLVGLAPAFLTGAFTSFTVIRNMTRTALKALANAKPDVRLEDVCENLDDPRDVEIVARCGRVWKDRYTLDSDAVNRAHQVIKAGLAMFPSSAYMVLLHANFMIDVLGVSQSGSSRIEDARKLNPSLMCRFIMFVRHQQATQKAAGNSANAGSNMDLLGYVEYQRKQRMVVRLHREALQAMCNFWKALDASKVSFMHLSKALSRIESSVSQAQTAYRVVLENYGHNPKLVRLYGKFLQTIKNDPWRASEYFTEADRLEEVKNGDARGPLLPDGTPLGRMDEMATAVMVINAAGEIQMANRHTHLLFGYKRGALEAKPLATLLAPHTVRLVNERLTALVSTVAVMDSGIAHDDTEAFQDVLVGMHYDRLAFPVKLFMRKVSGVGEDSTFVVMMEPIPPVSGIASVWASPNGTVAACDPQFVSNFGWRAAEVNGSNLMAFLSLLVGEPENTGVLANTDEESGAGGWGRGQAARPLQVDLAGGDTMGRLLAVATSSGGTDQQPAAGVKCVVAHKYHHELLRATVTVKSSSTTSEVPILEIRIKLDSDPTQLLVVNRKGAISHVSSEVVTSLKDVTRGAVQGGRLGAQMSQQLPGAASGPGSAVAGLGGQAPAAAPAVHLPADEELEGYTLFDFLPAPWKDMHMKFLRDSATVTPPGRSAWSCRCPALPGPTLELRTAGGKPLYMHVSVTSIETSGETCHVVRLNRSSLESALGERRLRLGVTEEGLVASISEGSSRLFGLEPGQIIGRGVWELIEEAAGPDGARLSTPGPRMLMALVGRSLSSPDHSWRVRVCPPTKPSKGGIMELAAAARATLIRHAVMQVHFEGPAAGLDSDDPPSIFIDLWPIASVTGVLDLEATGRVRAVLEEQTRPAGLLFGVPSQSLVGSMLGELVALPQGRTRPGDLLSLHGTKKSSLKSTKKETSVKVGPVLVLPASHADGQPLSLDVQVVGKPGSNQPFFAILRVHAAPLIPVPAGASTLAGGGSSLRPTLTSLPSAPQPLAAAANANNNNSNSAPAVLAAAPTSGAVSGKFVSMAAPRAGSPVAPPSPIAPQPSKEMQAKLILGSPPSGSGRATAIAAAAGKPPGSSPAADTPGGNGLPRADSLALDGMDGLDAITQTGYTSGAFHDGPVTLASPIPPDLLTGDGIPTPGITGATGKAAHLVGRSKLAGLVKAATGSSGLGSGSGAGAVPGEGEAARTAVRRGSGLPPRSKAPVERVDSADVELQRSPFSKVLDADDPLLRGAIRGTGAVDVQSVGESEDRQSVNGLRKDLSGNARISTWVASKGVFYQNTVKPDGQSDDDKSRRSGDFSDGGGGGGDVTGGGVVVSRARMHSAGFGGTPEPPARSSPLSPGMRSDLGGYADDDAASEGGQSAMSGQSGTGGAEYKRGKRFRKLIKLMDSSQAQLVQQRFRTHALITVGLLALVHVVCFALVVTAIQSQRASMLNLGHSGEAQRYMHQIMTDVRSLDVLSTVGSVDNLYNTSDHDTFVDRIARNAELVKARLNEVLNNHHRPDAKVLELFFYSTWPAWNGIDANGSDIYVNLTIWDFATRFYTMSTNIVQNHQEWIDNHVSISTTPAGQFLLKSGPDLWRTSRKILDELLFEAARNVHWVDTLQLIFLAVEGTVISSLAAFYLAYLLRSVAAQRHKLYCTFLVVPLGLTRALASQNTNLLVDDDDDDDMSDEDERTVAAVTDEDAPEEGDGDAGGGKVKRRATLNVREASSPQLDDDGGGGGGGGGGGLTKRHLFRSASAARGGGGGNGDGRGADRFTRQRSMTAESLDSRAERTGGGGWMNVKQWHVWRVLTRRGRGVAPLPQSAAAVPTSKRKLKDDSHETFVMMIPFVFWSALVITIYAVAVVQMTGVVQVVAIHSVSNFMSARTYRAVFFSQELAAVTDPALLPAKRAALKAVVKVVTDAWYTLQLGENAYKAAGPATERFPLVQDGLAYASPELADMFYTTGICHRMPENMPCEGPSYRFYQLTRSGMDSMMQEFLANIAAFSGDKSPVPPGLRDERFDMIYNVGSKDLLDGTVRVENIHYDTIIALFHRLLVLHVVLFLILWVVFAGFLLLLLNPLLKRIAKERRRIAELMSQLPLELDVERLVAKALGTLTTQQTGSVPPLGAHTVATDSLGEVVGEDTGGKGETTAAAAAKWKAIIRSASTGLNPSKKGTNSFTAGSMKKA